MKEWFMVTQLIRYPVSGAIDSFLLYAGPSMEYAKQTLTEVRERYPESDVSIKVLDIAHAYQPVLQNQPPRLLNMLGHDTL